MPLHADASINGVYSKWSGKSKILLFHLHILKFKHLANLYDLMSLLDDLMALKPYKNNPMIYDPNFMTKPYDLMTSKRYDQAL